MALPAWSWGDGPLQIRFQVQADETVQLRLFDGGPSSADPGLPPIDVLTVAAGRHWSGYRYAESVVGSRMRYRDHRENTDGTWQEHVLMLEEPENGLQVDLVFRTVAGLGVLRSFARLRNDGTTPVVIDAVTSLLVAGLPGTTASQLDDIDLYWADNEWLAENRWRQRPVRELLPDVDGEAHRRPPRGAFARSSAGGWSTGQHLPMGAVINRRTGHGWLWQIEHNGAWTWQVGEYRSGVYLALLGPTNAEHQWQLTLEPAESFETVPVALAVTSDGFDDAVARMTHYRRAVRRPHPDHATLPVVFNDYMNTLMGEPTTERLLPLIGAAAQAGAEYFCIDAGWYAEEGEDWWGSVGAWTPSRSRFPNGIAEVLDRIRSAGMIPGLWLEPEVVGVRSPIARELPADAFFQRGGMRVVEHGRYHLDLRHPAAVAHLDQVVDHLVSDLGVGYLKLDYNINIGSGTEAGGGTAGAGLLGHNRALLRWLDNVLDRYPNLVIENCASGAMRADHAMLARLQLQSTSDQQNFLRYPPIAVAAPVAVNPEQCANWAYPQPAFTTEEISFTLCTAILGRLYLSGHLDQMKPEQLDLVADAVQVYRRIRPQLAAAVPFWPMGLPGWSDSWFALGLRTVDVNYVVVWRRGRLDGTPDTAPPGVSLSLPHLAGTDVDAETIFLPEPNARPRWDPAAGRLTVRLPAAPAARLIALRQPSRDR